MENTHYYQVARNNRWDFTRST